MSTRLGSSGVSILEDERKKGDIRGEIKVYYTELDLSPQQIAEKLNISEKMVLDTLGELNLI